MLGQPGGTSLPVTGETTNTLQNQWKYTRLISNPENPGEETPVIQHLLYIKLVTTKTIKETTEIQFLTDYVQDDTGAWTRS